MHLTMKKADVLSFRSRVDARSSHLLHLNKLRKLGCKTGRSKDTHPLNLSVVTNDGAFSRRLGRSIRQATKQLRTMHDIEAALGLGTPWRNVAALVRGQKNCQAAITNASLPKRPGEIGREVEQSNRAMETIRALA
jgi:hypothetical protein